MGTVLLGVDDLLNVDAPSSSVDSQDLADLTSDTLVLGSDLDHNSISLSHWHGSAVVLGLEVLAEVAAHHLSSKTGWGGEVSLS